VRSIHIACLGIVLLAGCTTSDGEDDDATVFVGSKSDGATSQGKLRGTIEDGIHAFKGIPYAAPPVGELRWRAPQPPIPWTGVRDATKFGSGCVATSLDASPQVLDGQEDCLTLNVWTSSMKHSAAMPVMVFIHGGFFQFGSSADTWGGMPSYDGAYIAAHQPVVVVTLNYRLGALGFLADAALAASDPDGRAGNYGLLDQIAALQWVHDNITAFGGDPTRVLVFGESAGGFSVCNLIASPLAQGLFSAAGIESGGCSVEPRADALAAGSRVEKALGCDTASDVAACLRSASATAVATAIPAFTNNYEFMPNVDPGVLDGQPLSVIRNGNHNQVPVIVGTTSNEIASIMFSYTSRPLATDAGYKAQLELDYGTTFGDTVYAEYPSAQYGSPREAYIQVHTDSEFTCPARRIARTLVAAQTAPVYRYVYTHVLDEGPYQSQGAAHTFDLIFIFHAFDPVTFPNGASAAEQQFSDDLIAYWTRFAATGNPDGNGATSWPVYASAGDPYLAQDETFQAGSAFRPAQCNFWVAQGY
jgi:para-nitrobenzyl esterase